VLRALHRRVYRVAITGALHRRVYRVATTGVAQRVASGIAGMKMTIAVTAVTVW